MVMTTLAETLAAYAANLKFEALPTAVVRQVKRTTIDTLGCAFGGYDSEPAKIARELAALVGSSKPATVLGSGQRTSVELAAFANDVAVRYLDYNDGYTAKGGGHPSDSIAAVLAAAEVSGADGREVITAIVLAYDTYCRIADTWYNKLSGIDHTTIGGIASVVGAARAYGLTQAQTVEAINIMVAGHIALNQTRVGNVSRWKGCAYANANRNALFAVQLAARGMTGPAPIFEGRNGFFRIVSREDLQLALFGGNGQPFQIMKTHLKRFPLGNYSQTVVTAVLEARAQVADIRDIAQVHIHVSKKAISVMADDAEKWRPRNRETADHSMPYVAGVALMFGTVDESHFEEKVFLHDAALLELISRIQCSPSEEADRRDAEINLCEVELILRSGERKSVRAEYWRGHWRNPMSDAEVEEKFRALVGDKLPAARSAALLDQLWNLERAGDMATLMRMTEFGSSR
jgi:2-methylcitrate dehydratase